MPWRSAASNAPAWSAATFEVTVAGERLTNAGPLTEQQGIMEKILGFETLR